MSLNDRLNMRIRAKELFLKKEETAPVVQEEIIKEGSSILDILLEDKEITSVSINGAKNIYIEKGSNPYKSQRSFQDDTQLINALRKNAKDVGVDLSEKRAYAKYSYKKGVNITAAIPPLSNPPFAYIKCYQESLGSISELLKSEVISKETALILEVLANFESNILIIGNKSSYKTTLLNALGKTLNQNNRGVLIDYANEFNIESDNFLNYDFSLVKETIENDLLTSIMDSNPDRLIVNDCKDKTLNFFFERIKSGFRGLTTSILANSKEEAFDKIEGILSQHNRFLTKEEARNLILDSFDIIICLNSDKEKGKKLTSLSQIKNRTIENIFYLNTDGEYQSLGIIPEFFSKLKVNSPINSKIFDIDYKHTFHERKRLHLQEKTVNVDVIKKFKIQEPIEAEIQASLNYGKAKRVKEKFQKIKNNIKSKDFDLRKNIEE